MQPVNAHTEVDNLLVPDGESTPGHGNSDSKLNARPRLDARYPGAASRVQNTNDAVPKDIGERHGSTMGTLIGQLPATQSVWGAIISRFHDARPGIDRDPVADINMRDLQFEIL